MTQKDFTDFYAVLGVQIGDSENTIRKAYRKKALECHPDKNPNNPRANQLFHELSHALEIITDKAARTAYDNVWKARKAAEVRHKQLDSKRQKLKEDLEKRERESQDIQSSKNYKFNVSDEHILQEQIERLRREGSRLLEEEQAMLKKQLQKSLDDHMKEQKRYDSIYRLKIKWEANRQDPLNGGYSYDSLKTFLKKYGEIVALVMSKKSGSAMVEFKLLESAEMAISYEKGLLENPLKINWVTPPTSSTNQIRTTVTSLDYEDLVMRKLRQAQERQSLIEKLQKEDL